MQFKDHESTDQITVMKIPNKLSRTNRQEREFFTYLIASKKKSFCAITLCNEKCDKKN